MKQNNHERIRALLADGPLKTSEIGELLGISGRKIAATLRHMRADGQVVFNHGGPGRPASWSLPEDNSALAMLAIHRKTIIGRYLTSPAGARL